MVVLMRPYVCCTCALAYLAVWPGYTAGQTTANSQEEQYRRNRSAMVELIREYGVRGEIALRAMETVPRHEFVPREHRDRAYVDSPLPIGYGQTISQPFIVAFMTDMLEAAPGMKVLEIGTGSGYQTAVLAEVGCTVYTIEIFEVLAKSAQARLGKPPIWREKSAVMSQMSSGLPIRAADFARWLWTSSLDRSSISLS